MLSRFINIFLFALIAAVATVSAPDSSRAASASMGGLHLGSANYLVTQNAGSIRVMVHRAGTAAGVAKVNINTVGGSAVAGKNFMSSSASLVWQNGDTTSKSFLVTLNKVAGYSGSKKFSVSLSSVSGAQLGWLSTASVTVTGNGVAAPVVPPVTPPVAPISGGGGSTPPAGCAKSSSAWQSSSGYGYKQYGNYVAYLDNWGGLPGQNVWINDVNCWGATASASNTDFGYPRTYPHFTRGWSNDGSITELSTPGSSDWTTKSGMGIKVGSVTKAQLHWAFKAPLSNACAPYCRWDALADVYFHTSANPDPSQWPPYIDMQIIQQQDDQAMGGTTWNAAVASSDHASAVTIGGNTYVIIVDDAGGASFHQSGGHLITLLSLPTAFSSDNANPNWGVPAATHDIAAIIKYLMQSNPLNDAGKPLRSANGNNITSPLLTSNLYLSAVNAGWEINAGSVFNNTALCVAMQNEPDCP